MSGQDDWNLNYYMDHSLMSQIARFVNDLYKFKCFRPLNAYFNGGAIYTQDTENNM